MEFADRLQNGVQMEESGVTKLVSVSFKINRLCVEGGAIMSFFNA